ncbi:MAG: hypothetical protein IPH44_30090 [Myxococcales bacterium]|nr:hypothetical protein [Myxococcales bacterium]
MSATDLRPPPVASASGGWTPTTGDLRATVYGPAVVGTLQVTDPRAIASLAALRVPEIPRPPPIAAPPPPRTSRLAITGAALALPLPPLGLIVSTIALIQILAARPRRRGEAVAVLGVAASVIALAAALAVALGTR